MVYLLCVGLCTFYAWKTRKTLDSIDLTVVYLLCVEKGLYAWKRAFFHRVGFRRIVEVFGFQAP